MRVVPLMSAAIAVYKNFTLAVHVMVAAHGLIVRRMEFTDLTLKRVDRGRRGLPVTGFAKTLNVVRVDWVSYFGRTAPRVTEPA